jgi:hypothetical protein
MKALGLTLVVVMVLQLSHRSASAEVGDSRPAGWGDAVPTVARQVRAGFPLVVHVVVPLCHNGQVRCGDGGLGNPASLRTNLYWGALYGARRFFERPGLGWETVTQGHQPVGVLERVVYRRQVEGSRWGRSPTRPVEQLVVLDAVHGDAINSAVLGFYQRATRGGRLRIDDGKQRRQIAISVAGYAGHNRLMDGVALPAAPPSQGSPAVPSFVLACYSESTFGAALRRGGSAPLLMTQSFMAPEGYVVEATVRALGANRPLGQVRGAAVDAYARWQRISVAAAGHLFVPSR